MPRVFRAMTPDEDGHPKIAQTARGLGVRVTDDVTPDEANQVDRTSGGMSVAPTWRDLPSHRIPPRLNARLDRLEKDARGRDVDYCWRIGEGPFTNSIVSEQLLLVLDETVESNDPHGLIVSRTACVLSTYREALANTREDWVIDED